MPEILTNIAVVLIGFPTGVVTRIIAAELVETGIEAIRETDDSSCISYSVVSAFSIDYCTSLVWYTTANIPVGNHSAVLLVPRLFIVYRDSSFKYTGKIYTQG